MGLGKKQARNHKAFVWNSADAMIKAGDLTLICDAQAGPRPGSGEKPETYAPASWLRSLGQISSPVGVKKIYIYNIERERRERTMGYT
ncbi:unnamed protein product [Spirodela intermedia]|uniref:Uncharacterized protein n=1 Tax=Spirodela intermedia TaxID=51605 RepID=A0A7I8K5R3_SPIIN|nr:unnamed protein product [Spirodela intermedia]